MSDMVIYNEGALELNVAIDENTIWLTQSQMSNLFDTSTDNISLHLKNIYKEAELIENATTEDFSVVRQEGNRQVKRQIKHYNLDAVISVGYRVSSLKATKFRQWATSILKEHLIRGYTINQKRLNEKSLDELTATIELIKKTITTRELQSDEARGLLDIIHNYTKTWALLQGYDSNALVEQKGTKEQRFVLDYDEAKKAIESLKSDLIAKNEANALFGNEKADEFKGALLSIYQTFGGQDLLPSIEEKAANLLYYIIKDHPFSDGNKRIGSFLFILFLHKNSIAYKQNGEPKINDNALVSLALLTAQSEPNQKELLIKLIVNLLND